MTRSDLQKLARVRRREARLLLREEEYAGAYYLIGYAVECALKACIARKVRRYEFPDKRLANRSWVHGLEELIKTAGLEPELNKLIKAGGDFPLNWALVKDWKVEDRYSLDITPKDAKELYAAVTARKHGVMKWLRTKW
jgi:hypothetical protein